MSAKMFFITTIRLVDTQIDDQRPVGFFNNYTDAEERVLNNTLDIFECGYYKYAAIVEVETGLYPSQKEVQWFEYVRKEETYNIIKIEKPKLKDCLKQDFRPYIVG